MKSAKRQILFIAHRVPYPPNRGDRIRSFHLIRYLAERADVHLAFLTDEDVPNETKSALESICVNVTYVKLGRIKRWVNALVSFASGRTATEGLFYSSDFRNEIERLSAGNQIDAVMAFCSSVTQYLELSTIREVPTVVDLVDVDSQKWFDYADKTWGPKRWLFCTEGRRLRKLERSIRQRASAVTVVTEQEADLYHSFDPDYRPKVIRNGVDLDYFRPEDSESHRDVHFDSAKPDQHPSAVFVGALDYHANVDGAAWFCKQVWPSVLEQFPDAVFRLVGSRPNAKAISLGQLPGIELIGEVDDVRPYLHRATVVAVPLRVARGIQNKVLEALAAGKPTIVSPQALEGIGAEPGIHLMRASSDLEWTDQVTHLFQSRELRTKIGLEARDFVTREYGWTKQMEELCQLPGLLDCPAGETQPARPRS